MTEEEETSSRIKIVDKRRFTPEGVARSDVSREDNKKPVVPEAAKEAAAKKRQAAQEPQKRQSQSGVDFMTFIASLATSALASLGALPEARARGIPPDPQAAREYIEVIVMLQERTQGNLTPEEESSLGRVVNELRNHYNNVTRPPPPPGPGGMPGMPNPGFPRR